MEKICSIKKLRDQGTNNFHCNSIWCNVHIKYKKGIQCKKLSKKFMLWAVEQPSEKFTFGSYVS